MSSDRYGGAQEFPSPKHQATNKTAIESGNQLGKCKVAKISIGKNQKTLAIATLNKRIKPSRK
jgi:hypothetical protein